MINFLKKNIYPLLLSLTVFVIVLLNFKQNTWLTGWDNLHPEFNFSLNIKRSLFASWQEYQGLGLVGGMGHASDFLRQTLLFLLSFILKVNVLRYFWTFLMLFLGPLGVFYLLRVLLQKKYSQVSFLGALFYLLNLATVQIFYTPFEAFTTHYGFLPWLILAFLKYLKNSSRKNLIFFITINLLAISQSYVPTIFIVYLLALGFIFLGFLIKNSQKNLMTNFVRSLVIIFLVNAFWLLPFLYFTLANIKNPLESHNNFMQTEAIFLKNKDFGDLGNTAILRNFWFDYVEGGERTGFLVAGWREHLDNFFILGLGYAFFAISLIGVLYSIKKRFEYTFPFLFLFLFSFAMIANNTIPFSWLNDLLRRELPLISQVFRTPFTKFGNLAIFSYAVFFAWGLVGLKETLWKEKKKYLSWLVVFILSVLLSIYTLPIFSGNLFDKNLKLVIPEDYLKVFSFFASQDPYARIANLPQSSFWGWSYYQWGYHGSGFLWYGLNQPILDRAFDVWSKEGENYYWELSQAIYADNLELLEAVLEKYQISWLLLDENIRGQANYKALNYENIKNLFTRSEKIKLEKEFGQVKVYRVELNTPVKDFIFLVNNMEKIGPVYSWNDWDLGFLDYGHYISDNQNLSAYYPFYSLFTGRKQEELEFSIKEGFNSLIFQNKLPVFPNSRFIIPALREEEIIFWTPELKEEIKVPGVYINNNLTFSLADKTASKSGKNIMLTKEGQTAFEVSINKQKGFFSYDSSEDKNFFNAEAKNCDAFREGLIKKEVIKEDEGKVVRFTSQDSSNCLAIDLFYLSQKIGYLIKVENRNISGQPLLFYITNQTSKKAVIETYLPKQSNLTASYFIIPPMEEYGAGYTLNFNNLSLAGQKTVNDLGAIKVYPIPYQFLKELKVVNNQVGRDFYSSLKKDDFFVDHSNTSFYKIAVNDTAFSGLPLTLVLSQAYHPGWIAWEDKPFIGRKLDHVLVNNWQNGWQLNKAGEVYLFFWPQLLEYLGFIFLFLCLPCVLIRFRREHEKNS